MLENKFLAAFASLRFNLFISCFPLFDIRCSAIPAMNQKPETNILSKEEVTEKQFSGSCAKLSGCDIGR